MLQSELCGDVDEEEVAGARKCRKEVGGDQLQAFECHSNQVLTETTTTTTCKYNKIFGITTDRTVIKQELVRGGHSGKVVKFLRIHSKNEYGSE